MLRFGHFFIPLSPPDPIPIKIHTSPQALVLQGFSRLFMRPYSRFLMGAMLAGARSKTAETREKAHKAWWCSAELQVVNVSHCL